MAKRFYYSFKTMLKRTVTVDIYDRDYSGSAVELNKDVPNSPGCPSVTPVTIEEDNSTDMLDVIRIKTGYLNFIELVEGGLSALYAKDNSQISIEIRFSGNLIFKGYVQAQTFDSEWMSYRRKVKIPIQSYLGTMDEEPTSECDSTGDTLFGTIIENNFSRYSYIIMPEIKAEDIDFHSIHPLMMSCLNRSLSPYNEDYNFGIAIDGEIPSVYNPITMRVFLENMCKLYGLIAHDVAQNIILTRVDFWGNYLKTETGEASRADSESTIAGSSINVLQFYDYFQVTSEKNKIKSENALSKIHINVDEVPTEVDIDLSHSTYVGSADIGPSDTDLCTLQLQSDEVISQYFTTQIGLLSGTKVRVIGDGDIEMLQVVANVYDTVLFKCYFETKKVSKYNRLIVEAELTTEQMYVSVQSGGKYYNYGDEGDQWITTASYKELTFTDGKSEVEISSNGPTVIVSFYAKPTVYAWEVLFKSISMKYEPTVTPYLRYNVRDVKYIMCKGDMASSEEIDTENNFYNSIVGYVGTPQYKYMLESQRVLTITARNITIIDDTTLYMSKIQIGSDTTLWRVVAISRNLRDDEYTLTLMHSDLADTLTPPN